MNPTKYSAGLIFLILAAQLLPAPARAAAQIVYTSRETLKEGRIRFSACSRIEGFGSDRCEIVGDPRGYTPDQLHRGAERALDQAQDFESGNGRTSKAVIGGAVVGAAVGGTSTAYGLRSSTQLPIRVSIAAFAAIGGAAAGGFAGLLPASILHDRDQAEAMRLSSGMDPLKENYSNSGMRLSQLKEAIQAALAFCKDDTTQRSPRLSDALMKELSEPDAPEPASAPESTGRASLAR